MRVKIDLFSQPMPLALADAAAKWVGEGNRPRYIAVNPVNWERLRAELTCYSRNALPAGGGFDLHAESWEPGEPVKIRTSLCGFVVAIAADPSIPKDEAEFS